MTELPWFKFTASEWLSGDIRYMPYETQGVFINLCALYWKHGCSIAIAKLERRLSIDKDRLEDCLIDLKAEDIIQIVDGVLVIGFLDQQYKELTAKHNKRVEAGRKGGKAKAMLKQSPSIKEVEEEREEDKEQEHPPLDPAQPITTGEVSAVDPMYWIKGKGRLFRNSDLSEWEEVLTDHGESVCSEAYEQLKSNHKGTIFPNTIDEYIRETGGNGATSEDNGAKVKELLKQYSWPQRALKRLGPNRCKELIDPDQDPLIELDGFDKTWNKWAFNLPQSEALPIAKEAELV